MDLEETKKYLASVDIVRSTQILEECDAIYIMTNLLDHKNDYITFCLVSSTNGSYLTDDELMLSEFELQEKELTKKVVKSARSYDKKVCIRKTNGAINEITYNIDLEVPSEEEVKNFAVFIKEVLISKLKWGA